MGWTSVDKWTRSVLLWTFCTLLCVYPTGATEKIKQLFTLPSLSGDPPLWSCCVSKNKCLLVPWLRTDSNMSATAAPRFPSMGRFINLRAEEWSARLNHSVIVLFVMPKRIVVGWLHQQLTTTQLLAYSAVRSKKTERQQKGSWLEIKTVYGVKKKLLIMCTTGSLPPSTVCGNSDWAGPAQLADSLELTNQVCITLFEGPKPLWSLCSL